MQYRRIAALLLLLATAPMASGMEDAPVQQPAAGIQSLRFTSQFKTGQGNDVDPAKLPDKIILAYRLDPGWVIGGSRNPALARDLQAFTLDRDEQVIDIAAWAEVAARSAKPLSKKDTKRGISVTPAETRLGSVYQFAYSPGSGRLGGRYLGRYSELRDRDDRYRQLMYFDRPCRVTGRLEPANDEQRALNVDIDVPAAGFHFLRYVGRPNDEHGLVLGPGVSEVVLVTQF